jgi:hypothetical protein
MFCAQYAPPKNTKSLSKDDILEPHHWEQLANLYDQLESFDEATCMVEGRHTNLADHFQTLDWLLLQLDQAKHRFNELYSDTDLPEYKWLAGAADVSWAKCNKYYNMADQTAAYYLAIIMNPTLKTAWFQQRWSGHTIRSTWLKNDVLPLVKELWFQEYKGKSSASTPTSTPMPMPGPKAPKHYMSCREHKRLKLDTHFDASVAIEGSDELDEYLSTNVVTTTDEHYDPIQYWNDRFCTQPDLAQMALDALAVPPCSDELERLFSSAKLLITPHRSRLHMDIIEANECLRAWFGRPVKGSFDDRNIGMEEGETLDDNHEYGQSLEDKDEGDHVEDQEGGPTTPINVS